jgi:TPR repeat protein
VLLSTLVLGTAAWAGPDQEAPVCNPPNDPLRETDFQSLLAASTEGDPNAQWNLGLRYLAGHGVDRDFVSAREWLDKAASQGCIDAYVNIGVMYEIGMGVERSDSEALNWYKRAATAGHAFGMWKLGAFYLEGRGGLPRDTRRGEALQQEVRSMGFDYSGIGP